METRLAKIEAKIDSVLDEIKQIHKTLDKNTDSLIIHEKRTDLAEHKLRLLEIELEKLTEIEQEERKSMHTKLDGVVTHVNAVNWLLKYIIPASAAIIVAMYKMGLFDNIK